MLFCSCLKWIDRLEQTIGFELSSPSLPFPSLPRLPFPTLPSFPFPSLPSPSLSFPFLPLPSLQILYKVSTVSYKGVVQLNLLFCFNAVCSSVHPNSIQNYGTIHPSSIQTVTMVEIPSATRIMHPHEETTDRRSVTASFTVVASCTLHRGNICQQHRASSVH
jgi:hypothetical protein